jgi:hypothetical protein
MKCIARFSRDTVGLARPLASRNHRYRIFRPNGPSTLKEIRKYLDRDKSRGIFGSLSMLLIRYSLVVHEILAGVRGAYTVSERGLVVGVSEQSAMRAGIWGSSWG